MVFKKTNFTYGAGDMVDSERNITLLNKPCAPEMPHVLELYVGEKKIIFEVEDQTKGIRSDKKFDVYWKINRAQGDESLIKRKGEIVEIMNEALNARGLHGRDDLTGSVTVDFNNTIWG